MYNSVPTNFISVPTKSYFFLPGGAGAPPGPLGKYAYGCIALSCFFDTFLGWLLENLILKKSLSHL